uniref:Transposase n=1 Tax=Romanomermis culicivorax TaxID=13658 RepID=A0A915JSU1_ROMCU
MTKLSAVVKIVNTKLLQRVFLQKISEANFGSREIQELFKLLADWRSQKVRVFLITVNNCAFNFLNKEILREPSQYKVLMGHMVINSYEAAIDRVAPAVAQLDPPFFSSK